MTIDFGTIISYKSKGYGFVTRTFFNPNEKVYFHIKTIKKEHFTLARTLDTLENTEVSEKVDFWYKTEKTEKGVQVSDLWLHAQNIPQTYRNELSDLIDKVENAWRNIKSPKPSWLDLVTIDLIGVERRDQLSLERDNLESQAKAAEEKRHKEEEARREIVRTDQSRTNRIVSRNAPIREQIPPARDRFRSERGIIESIFASNEMHGLPPELQKIVRPCPRGSRKNPKSHIPGGSDVVVAYSLGDAILYDWIKSVPAYISVFEQQDPGFHLYITSIYGRFLASEDEDTLEYERKIGVFCPIWTCDENEVLLSAVKACASRYQRQMEIGYTTLHEKATEYWKNKYNLSKEEAESLPTLYKQYMKEEKGLDVDYIFDTAVLNEL